MTKEQYIAYLRNTLGITDDGFISRMLKICGYEPNIIAYKPPPPPPSLWSYSVETMRERIAAQWRRWQSGDFGQDASHVNNGRLARPQYDAKRRS